MGPTWGPPGSCRPQVGPMLAHKPCYQGICQVANVLLMVSNTIDSQCKSLWYLLQSSAVITRSHIVRYHINNYRNWGRISIRCWIHKRHPIPHPNRWAMSCDYVWENLSHYNGTTLYLVNLMARRLAKVTFTCSNQGRPSQVVWDELQINRTRMRWLVIKKRWEQLTAAIEPNSFSTSLALCEKNPPVTLICKGIFFNGNYCILLHTLKSLGSNCLQGIIADDNSAVLC